MAILKCKMCGGDIALNEEKTFGTCEYCGSVMTLPKVSDDQRAARFNRGNHFRRQGEFDKALAVYESIVREDDTDAEAHWCCALCRFGIEYVEDPNTYEYLPTCHRASFDSFTDDVDYLAALENSDGITKRQYQKDAAKIAEVQKGILATSQNEQPYDIFICYKETDDNTKERTRDSLDAQDIYYQLTQEGYRVFFSRITLEDKVGTEYEPYIFAALNSAKVMIAIGSKPEYFNAVWVKNEWSRFLAMMRKDRSKLLLPCYKDMDPYDMPEQLGVLQSYDMAKIGFMQELIRGIKKILKKDEPKQAVKEKVVVNSGSGNVAPLLKRAFMFLEDGDWSSADEYAEKVLDLDPENAEAYLGKLMAELKLHNKEQLADCDKPFYDLNNYKKAFRFGDEALKEELSGYTTPVIYNNGVRVMNEAKTEREYKRAAEIFKSIPGWKDANMMAEQCLAKGLKVFKESKERCQVHRKRIEAMQGLIMTNYEHTVGLKSDGTVIAVGCNTLGECDVKDWTDIVAIAAGSSHTVGLKSDGTVVATEFYGDKFFYEGQCDVNDWKDIVAVSAGGNHTLGLKSNGTVVAVGDNHNGQCDVNDWKDIVAIAAGSDHTVGLKSDGTVEVVGNNEYGQCNVNDWKDIVAIAAGSDHTVGLKSDGTVEVVGNNEYGQCNVNDWNNIVAVAAGGVPTIGLKADGTVVATEYTGNHYEGECDVQDWSDIVAVATGRAHTLGLTSKGTVVAVGDNREGQCDVSEWKLFKSETEKEEEYNIACELEESEIESELKKAVELFESLKEYKDSAERVNVCQEAYEKKKAERIECEHAEAERKRAEEVARRERERAEKIAKMNSEKSALQAELSNLKGLFSGKRRKEIEVRLAQIDNELKNL